MDFSELVDNFSFLDGWEDRYAYLIELGKALPAMDDADKTPENKVDGCMSQVWLTMRRDGDRLFFRGESDAFIVRGLIAVLQIILSGKTFDEIAAEDVEADFNRLGLDAHLSPTRRNGFFSMVARVKAEASRLRETL